jgi:hypothetical protein
VPIRVTSRGPDPVGPKPFSEEWLSTSREVAVSGAPSRTWPAPREGLLAALVVVCLVLLTAPWSAGIDLASDDSGDDIPVIAGQLTPASEAGAGAGTPPPDDNAGGAPAEQTSEAAAQEPTATATSQAVAEVPEGALLPEYRILSYYGFPGVPQMGILGEYEMADLMAVLQDQAAEYEQVDPNRPVKLAFEVITSVAQQWQQEDGSHLAYIDMDRLQEYVDFTAANDMLLILDMQFGRKTVQEEVDAVREFLKYPHVHLALDPEFAVDEGEIPSEVIGQIDAADVQYALEELAKIAEENNIPPKMLIVHQFVDSSITNRESIVPVPGVQLVLEIDGFGTPEQKRSTYAHLTEGSSFDFYGFKLWYSGEDDPLMSPAEVLSLSPVPDLVIYQ